MESLIEFVTPLILQEPCQSSKTPQVVFVKEQGATLVAGQQASKF